MGIKVKQKKTKNQKKKKIATKNLDIFYSHKSKEKILYTVVFSFRFQLREDDSSDGQSDFFVLFLK